MPHPQSLALLARISVPPRAASNRLSSPPPGLGSPLRRWAGPRGLRLRLRGGVPQPHSPCRSPRSPLACRHHHQHQAAPNLRMFCDFPETTIHWQRRWNSVGGDGASDEYTAEQRRKDHEHCVDTVQNRDLEGYLCGLLMPSHAREAHFALRAFNVEIAGIKDSSVLSGGRGGRGLSSHSHGRFDGDYNKVGDSSLASRMRMQWWMDAVAHIYEDMDAGGGSRRHEQRAGDSIMQALASSRWQNPTLRGLDHAIRTHGLTHRFILRMMEARDADLDLSRHETLGDAVQYGEATVSSFLYLSLECAGVREDNTDAVASDVGVGLGLLTALRSTAFRAARGESSIPADLASKHSVSTDTTLKALDLSVDAGNGDSNRGEGGMKSHESLRGACREMAELALFRLHRARSNQHMVPREGRACLLPAVCGLRYLDHLREVDYDVFHPSLMGGGTGENTLLRKRRLGLMFLLGRAWLTGIF